MNELEILNTLPPRKLETIRPLIKSSPKITQILLLSAPFLFGILYISIFSDSNLTEIILYGIPISLLLVAIPVYLASLINSMSKKSSDLLQNAISTEGKIMDLQFHPRSGLKVEVNYIDHTNRNWTGKALAGFPLNYTMKIGDPIQVFYDPDKPNLFVIYLQNIGLAFGGINPFR